MRNDLEKIAGLVQLSGVHFRAVQAEMAALQQQEARLRRNLAQLIESRQARSADNCTTRDAAMIAGADLRWHRWVDQRRAAINAELAQILSAKERCRSRFQRAFGRDQATRALRDRVEKQQRVISLRLCTYES